MFKALGFLVLTLLLSNCAGRTAADVFRGSRKSFPAEAYWNVLSAAQGVLQRDGFIVNLTQQNRGVLVASLQKQEKKNRAMNRITNQTGATFRVGDYVRVMINVQMNKKKQTELRVSVLRERENEWTQEDGDEIGNQEFYTDFFGRVDKAMNASSSTDTPPPQG